MKKVFFLLVVVCMSVAYGFGQEPQTENANAPEITFEQTTYDFGTVPFKGTAECEFVCTNTGKEPLIIQNCQSSCGCTAPTCPKNKPIKPGEKEVIKVRYNTTNVPGSFTKNVMVYSNAKTSVVTLTIKGVVAQNEATQQ